jgi:hypothetical protein
MRTNRVNKQTITITSVAIAAMLLLATTGTLVATTSENVFASTINQATSPMFVEMAECLPT